ncbi:MAG: exo-alpha-sialidase [Gemmatimonadetes bacterium]|nr:exo-alpha-sialidase [Gemmatimonadota bacterium]
MTVSRIEHRGSEPGIALDPNNPARVIAAYGGPWLAYSTDSGATFALAPQVKAEGVLGGGDVSVAFDDAGAAYLSFLTSDGLGTPSYWAHHAGKSGIWVARSPDGGRTWPTPAVPVKQWPNSRDPAPQMVDMSRIWTDAHPASPHHGNLYVAWINWELDRSVIQFSRSTDHGATWTVPRAISTKPGLPRDDNGGLVAPIGVVAPDGTMHVIWNDQNSIVYTSSRDGGRTFAPSRSIVPVGPPYFGGATGVPGVVRVMGFPQVGLDAKRNILYVTWSDFRNGDVDVFLAKSTDGGRHWSAPVRVNDDPIHDGRDQFFQWLAVDPENGDLYVQFYDRREDTGRHETRVTLARSTNQGASFTNYAWSDAAFTGDNVFLGDYAWLVAKGGRAYGVWVEAVPPDPSAPAGARPRTGTLVKVGTADFRGVR